MLTQSIVRCLVHTDCTHSVNSGIPKRTTEASDHEKKNNIYLSNS